MYIYMYMYMNMCNYAYIYIGHVFSLSFCLLAKRWGRAAKKRLRGVFRGLGGAAVQLHAARQRHVAKALAAAIDGVPWIP